MPELNGILLIDKPTGLTSAAVVRIVKKTLKVERVGHLGTLDPFASGLLPLCLGVGTKIARFLMSERKAYTGTIHLGIETDTLDATGKILRTLPVPPCRPETLRDIESRFFGEYWQTPPMYSALKHNGVPLYKLARRGVIVDREPRKVVIEALTLRQLAEDTLCFTVSCSKGTYVRSLAADVGVALGCGAHLATLRRITFGHFSVGEAIPFQVLINRQLEDPFPLLAPSEALRHYRTAQISHEMAARLRCGQQDALRELAGLETGDQDVLPLLDPGGDLVAVAELHNGQWRLARVL